MTEEIVQNRCAAEFVATVDGTKVGILKYSVSDGTMNIFSTFVEPEFRGKGIASRLTDRAEEFAKKEGLKVVASCSFVAAQIGHE